MAEFPRHPFLLSVAETAQALSTDIEKGLTSSQVAQLQQKYPKNELDIGEGIPWYSLLMKQILNAMIIVSHQPAPSNSDIRSFILPPCLSSNMPFALLLLSAAATCLRKLPTNKKPWATTPDYRFWHLPWLSALASGITLKEASLPSSSPSMSLSASGRSTGLKNAWMRFVHFPLLVPWYYAMARRKSFRSEFLCPRIFSKYSPLSPPSFPPFLFLSLLALDRLGCVPRNCAR